MASVRPLSAAQATITQSVCLLCLSETEAEASESHLQLCGRQPGRADVL